MCSGGVGLNADSLITRYRPDSFDYVLGQDDICDSIITALDRGDIRSVLFTGGSGTGKTTLARIIAKEVGCEPQGLIEIDAATNTGVDAMRDVTDTLKFKAFGASPTKVVIVDEAHALSKNAWASLLKNIEEPPPHVYWMLCTTDASKVPQTIKTRCTRYDLKPVSTAIIYGHISDISTAEELAVSDDVLDLIAREADGSVRKALADLVACTGCTDRKVAAKLLLSAAESPTMIDLCRYLAKKRGGQGLQWGKLAEYVQALQGDDPEGVRLGIVAYFTKASLGGNAKEENVAWYLTIIDAFSTPCDRSTKAAPLLLALGSLVFGA